jgi:hypothetical protein
MTKAQFQLETGHNEFWDYERGLGWGSGPEGWLRYILLIAEDFAFTFQACEQLGHKDGVPYGPKGGTATW